MFESSGFSGLLLLHLSHVAEQSAQLIGDHTWASLLLLLPEQAVPTPRTPQVPGSQAVAELRAAASALPQPQPAPSAHAAETGAPSARGDQLLPATACHASWNPQGDEGLCHSMRLQAGAIQVALNTPHYRSGKDGDIQSREYIHCCWTHGDAAWRPVHLSHCLFSRRIQPVIKTVLPRELCLFFICPQMDYTDITHHHRYLYHGNSNNFRQDPWLQLVSSISLEMFDVGSLNNFDWTQILRLRIWNFLPLNNLWYSF